MDTTDTTTTWGKSVDLSDIFERIARETAEQLDNPAYVAYIFAKSRDDRIDPNGRLDRGRRAARALLAATRRFRRAEEAWRAVGSPTWSGPEQAAMIMAQTPRDLAWRRVERLGGTPYHASS